MAIKKFTDKEKVERAKEQILRCLTQIRDNSNRAEVLGYITGQLAHTFALLDADKQDEMAIVYVAANIMDELDPKPKQKVLPSPMGEQLPLVEAKK